MSRARRARKAMMFREGAPKYSAKTMAKIAELQGKEGVNRVAVFHDYHCAEELAAGEKKCICDPEVKIVDENSQGREKRAFDNHWVAGW